MAISPDAVVIREFSVRADGTREYKDIPLFMGSDAPGLKSGDIGGRLILHPGKSTPEIEPPDVNKPNLIVPQVLVPGDSPGTLSTLVPVESDAAPEAVPAHKNSQMPTTQMQSPGGAQ